jgi:predicted nucleic acid-binding protein
MALVISDASTLIHLANIGRVGLLRDFFGRIVIPPAVWKEVVELGEGRLGAKEERQKDLSKRECISISALDHALSQFRPSGAW